VTFRTRILLACLAVGIAPLVLFALGARREVRERIGAQFEARVDASTATIRRELRTHTTVMDTRLSALARRIDNDPRLRAELLQLAERATLLDYAAQVMPTIGVDYLLLIDSAGSVLSSGHFRNEFDRQMNALPALRSADGPVLIATRRADGTLLALVRAHAFDVGGRSFVLAGGIAIDTAFVRDLAGDASGTLVVSLRYPGGTLASGPQPDRSAYIEEIPLRFIDDVAGAAGAQDAHWMVTHSLAPLHAVQRGMDMWLLAALAGAVVLALLIAQLLAARVTQPLEELAQRSTQVNLDDLDVALWTQRTDEIGTLSLMLDTMVHRLRSGAHELRAAERRAVVGDLARQVNHDIRNGLLPIRNVIRHLSEVAHTTPNELAPVFSDRESTLQGGISYLESLAANYARLTPRTERQRCDLNAVVRTVLEHATTAGDERIRMQLSASAPRVSADPVALRRVIENLVVNALESLERGTGKVTVQTAATDHVVTLTVADTGAGIDADVLDRIFDDFYTTKERGTGLGLSIVRRLVADMGGRIHVESERNRGTTFRITLPEAG
jgi:signal transduction histidine kinase